MSRPAGCAPCTGLRISETADTLEGATLGRNATRNHTQYPFKFIRMHGVWDFHPCQRPVTEPCMRILGDSYFPGDRLLNTLGLLAGPYRFTLAWPVRGYTPATFPGMGLALWHFAKILICCLRDMPDNTRNPHMRSTTVLNGGPTGSRPEKRSTCPRSTFI